MTAHGAIVSGTGRPPRTTDPSDVPDTANLREGSGGVDRGETRPSEAVIFFDWAGATVGDAIGRSIDGATGIGVAGRLLTAIERLHTGAFGGTSTAGWPG